MLYIWPTSTIMTMTDDLFWTHGSGKWKNALPKTNSKKSTWKWGNLNRPLEKEMNRTWKPAFLGANGRSFWEGSWIDVSMIYCSPCRINMDRKMERLWMNDFVMLQRWGSMHVWGLFLVACFLFFSPYPVLKNQKKPTTNLKLEAEKNLPRQGWWSETLTRFKTALSISRLCPEGKAKTEMVMGTKRGSLIRSIVGFVAKQDATETRTKQL